jgi:H+/Cl- antiporter ClcA
MKDLTRQKAVAVFDIIVALIIIGIGFYTIVFSLYFSDFVEMIMDTVTKDSPFKWLRIIPWLILGTGFAIILYGVKRIIDNVLKMFVKE